MLKRAILWIIPLLIIAIVAVAFVAEPSIGAHASGWNGM